MFEILEELNLEYCCINVRHYNILLRLRDKNELKADELEQMRDMYMQERKEKYT